MSRLVALASAAAFSLLPLLSGCGGGGGSSSTTATTPSPSTPSTGSTGTTGDTSGTSSNTGSTDTASALVLSFDDQFSFAGPLSGDGTGIWSGDLGGDGGSGDAAGAAGDGEFVKVRMKFPFAGSSTGTLNWVVVRSQYGITGRSGSMDIQRDTSSTGGYRVLSVNGSAAAVRSSQANFFLSRAGQITGTLPLPIGAGGAIKDALFSGVRVRDAAALSTDYSDVAGNYVFGVMASVVQTGADKSVGAGVLRFDAQGLGRVCGDTAQWSLTCANGIDVVVRYADAGTRNVLRIQEAAKQSQPIAAGMKTGIDILAVVRRYGVNGMSLSGDFVATGPQQQARTGAVYASRQNGSALEPQRLVGAWNYAGAGTDGSSVRASFGIAQVSTGAVRMAIRLQGQTTCRSSNPSLVPAEVTGVLRVVDTSTALNAVLIQLDDDLALLVQPEEELGLMRRYANDPGRAPCQPS